MFPIRSLILCTAAMVAPLLTSGPTVHVASTAHTAIVAVSSAVQDDYADYCGDAALAEHEYIDDADDLAAGKACAARFILERMDSEQPMYEDWTWQGMSPVVGEFAGAMQVEADATDADDETYLAYATHGVFPLRPRTVV